MDEYIVIASVGMLVDGWLQLFPTLQQLLRRYRISCSLSREVVGYYDKPSMILTQQITTDHNLLRTQERSKIGPAFATIGYYKIQNNNNLITKLQITIPISISTTSSFLRIHTHTSVLPTPHFKDRNGLATYYARSGRQQYYSIFISIKPFAFRSSASSPTTRRRPRRRRRLPLQYRQHSLSLRQQQYQFNHGPSLFPLNGGSPC